MMVEQALSVLGTLSKGLNKQGSPKAGQGLSSGHYSEHRARWTEGLGMLWALDRKFSPKLTRLHRLPELCLRQLLVGSSAEDGRQPSLLFARLFSKSFGPLTTLAEFVF